ncbi:MAG: sensor histidine kinase [Lachnospiraceae bacterium]
MKLKERIKKHPYLKPVIVGFFALYIVCMLLATYLMSLNYENQYEDNMNLIRESILKEIDKTSETEGWNHNNITQNEYDYMSVLLQYTDCKDTPYQQISAAIYDPKGNLIAKSGTRFLADFYLDNMEKVRISQKLSDYLTQEEINQLAQYRLSVYRSGSYEPSPYLFAYELSESCSRLAGIYVYRAEWEEMDEKTRSAAASLGYHTYLNYYLTNKEAVWEWHNPELADSDPKRFHFVEGCEMLNFPELQFGFSNWKRWEKSSYLNHWPDKIDGGYLSPSLYQSLYSDPSADMVCPFNFYFDDTCAYTYTLMLRSESHSWLEAMDYLKLVYVFGLLLVLTCIIKVSWSMNKIYEERICLEESRRDFTNAVAHELKTPLGIIRGFAENLLENTAAEKRDYYLENIIGQTEIMDKLVQEMIYISRLDSGQPMSKSESVNLVEITKEQFEKLSPAMKEKNLDIRYETNGDYIVFGDRSQLEKALWNLVENAIEYNIQDGLIQVTASADSFSIDNTAAPIPEEKLPHLCEMFYTVDQSRTAHTEHNGLGLYLAERIFTMHHLEMSIINSLIGVRVTIKNN